MITLKKWFHKICQSVWAIGFMETSIDDIIAGKPYKIKWVDVPTDCWYADPFILNVTENKIDLLVEEWNYDREKGSISKITINSKTNKIIDRKAVLQLDTHLSFPVIYKMEEHIYVCPENSESGSHNAYIYDEVNDTVTRCGSICALPLTDAVSTDLLGENYLFSTQSSNANGKELSVFKWNSKKSIFELTSSISFDENIARMAGHFFKHKGLVYRPAQVCNSAYGQAVSLQKVEMKNGVIEMTEIRRLTSTHKHLINGMHTFNYSQGVIVVDAWGWKAPFLRRFFVDDWGNIRGWIKCLSKMVQW